MDRFNQSDLRTSTTRRGQNSTGKTWVKRRILTMAELRGAPVPSSDAQIAYASALSGFSEATIEAACQRVENTVRGDYEPAMPPLAKLEEVCREITKARQAVTRWCGRCTLGCIRGSDNVIRRCECSCTLCENSGWIVKVKPVFGMPYKEANFASRCPKGCRVTGSEAA